MFDADDGNHPAAQAEWQNLLDGDEMLVTSNYVLVETLALLQHRLGLPAVRAFQDDVVPLLRVEWGDEATHGAGMSGLLAAHRRGLAFRACRRILIVHLPGQQAVISARRH